MKEKLPEWPKPPGLSARAFFDNNCWLDPNAAGGFDVIKATPLVKAAEARTIIEAEVVTLPFLKAMISEVLVHISTRIDSSLTPVQARLQQLEDHDIVTLDQLKALIRECVGNALDRAPSKGASGDQGTPLVFRGAFDLGVDYSRGDLVQKAGALHMATADTSGVAPGGSANWRKLT